MKKNFVALIWSLGIGLPAIALASGGYYLFHSEQVKNDAITAKLSSFSSGTQNGDTSQQNNSQTDSASNNDGSEMSVPAKYAENAYTADAEAVTIKTDVLFSDPQTPDPKLLINTNEDIKTKINALRADITTTLNEWQALINEINSTGATQTPAATIKQYTDSIQEYIAELKAVTDGLTPDNSGLTPTEIVADQAVVDAAIAEADKAVATIDAGIAESSGGTSGAGGSYSGSDNSSSGQADQSSGSDNSSINQSNSPSDASNLSSSSGDSSNGSSDSSGGTGDSSNGTDNSATTPLAPPPDNTPFNQPNTGAPRLIEGSNSI